MADAIFISYRRDDSEGEAGRLFSDLTRAFGKGSVFMDVTGIKPGADFRKAIEDNVAVCGVFLAIVGPEWVRITNSEGLRRLDDPRDFVALELSSALRREVPVIPVLVHDAKMPAVDLLPESLKAFCYRNSVELSHTRWDSDVQLLIEALKPYIAPPKLAVQPPVHATIPVQLPPPNAAAFRIPPPPPKKSKVPLILGISAAAILVIILLAIIGNLSDKKENTSNTAPINPEPAPMPAANPTVTTSSTQTQSSTPTKSIDESQQPESSEEPKKDPPIMHHQAIEQPQPPAAITGPQHPGLAGRWKYPLPRTGNSLQRLVISTSGAVTLIHPFGSCVPIECDWGTQQVLFNGPVATAVFRLDPYMDTNGYVTQRYVKILASPDSGKLDVVVLNNFQNQLSGVYKSQFNLLLVPDE